MIRTERFPVAGTLPELEVRNPAGTVTVEAREGAAEVVVEVEPLDAAAEGALDRVEVSASEGRIRVTAVERRLFRSPSFAVRVLTPPGADTRVEAASAAVSLRGRLGDVRISTASGDVAVEDCARLKVRTASGDSRLGSVDGRLTVGTASGDVTVDSAGDGLDVRSASGNVSVGECTGDVSVGTASGSVAIGAVRSGAVRVRTASGDVEIGVAPGLRVWLDLSSMSGRMNSSLTEEGPDDDATDQPATVTLSLRSMSGGLRVGRAATVR